MLSFWEKESFLDYDVLIIGAGITGLSTAASLKEKNPQISVCVLEQGTLPSGASTKNAGFACFGSISELSQDRKALGDEGMVKLVQRRWNGLQKTIERLGANRIGLELKGGYELLSKDNEFYAEELEELNGLLSDSFPEPVFTLVDDKIESFGFNNTRRLVYNQYEGQVHTGKMMHSLWHYCNSLGISVHTGTRTSSLTEANGTVQAKTDQFTFSGKACAICTNAFTPQLINEALDITPGRGMVLSLQPDKPLRFEGTFHIEEGYYYFRDFGQKLIFGGGRNLDIETETTTDFGINATIEARLHQLLKSTILPDIKYKTEMKWSGIMAFGANKSPIVIRYGRHQYLGVRLGGMGVALGSMVGEELAQMIISDCF